MRKSRLLKVSDGRNAGMVITLFDQYGKNKLLITRGWLLPYSATFMRSKTSVKVADRF
jgi:hypothetical protein